MLNILNNKNINLSFFISLSITVLFVLLSPECQHWFVIPVALCGFLVGLDAANWLIGDYDTFDVYGISGGYGLFFFLIAPLLTVSTGSEPRFISDLPKDWRPWLGQMSCLNLAGLLLYYPIRSARDRIPFCLKTTWIPSPRNFYLLMPIFLVISLALQVVFWVKTGGITAIELDADLSGMGFLFMFSESFPILLLISVLIYIKINGKRFTPTQIIVMFFCFFLLVFVFKGLRGSRSNVVWTIITALIIIDMTQFTISKKWLAYLVVPFFIFMTIYGLFKNLRGDIVNVQSYDEYVEKSDQFGRDWKSMLTGDLGRSDIQALLLYRLMTSSDYQYAYGETYLAALSLPLPGQIRPELRFKANAGANILYGQDNLLRGPEARKATRIYGLAGEGMLNFGLIGGVLMFIPYAFVISWIRRFQRALRPDDLRCYLFPALFVMTMYWAMDLDNLLFGAIKNYAFILLVIYLFTTKLYIQPQR